MKKTTFIALIIASTFANADDKLINFNLQNAKLTEVIKMFYTSIDKQDFVISSEIEQAKTPVNISVNNKTKEQALELFNYLLSENNIYTTKVGGVTYLKKDTKTNIPVTQNLPIPVIDNFNQSPTFNAPTNVELEPTSYENTVLTRNLKDVTIYRPSNIPPDELVKILRFANIKTDVVNDLIIYEPTPENKAFVDLLLKQFDGLTKDIIIKATVIEYNKQDRSQTAIQAAFNILKNTLSFAVPAINLNASTLTLTTGTFNAAIASLANDDSFKVLSSPTLRVSHKKQSFINVGAEVPVLTSLTQTNTGQPLQNVEYKTSGIVLEVTPKIYTDIIELDLLQQVSDFVPTTNGVNSTPTLIQRKLKTTIKMRDGDTVIMGGLNQTRDDYNKSTTFFGFPTSNSTGKTQTDLLLILHIEKV